MHTWGRFVFQEKLMTSKEFKSIDEQIKILESRGLNIPEKETAKDFLLKNNYYRISGYSLTLRKNDIFYKNATFQNIMDIYHFDHELRHILLKYIEMIEVHIKSVFAYEFTKQHGAAGYLDPKYFTDINQHKIILDNANKQKNKRLPHEAYLKHFICDLKQDIPLWAFVDLLTIADISFLYSISEDTIKDAVAAEFGLKVKSASKILSNHLHSMTIIRNLCAHGSRLYNRLFEQKPSINKQEKKLLRTGKDGTIDNAHLYGFVIIMRKLLPPRDFAEMKEGILQLCRQYPFVRMDYYGFRSDWKTAL